MAVPVAVGVVVGVSVSVAVGLAVSVAVSVAVDEAVSVTVSVAVLMDRVPSLVSRSVLLVPVSALSRDYKAWHQSPVIASRQGKFVYIEPTLSGKHMGHTTVRGNAGRGNSAAQTLRTGDITVAQLLSHQGGRCGGRDRSR